ncbi:PTPA-CTERM sorting domain-containing protein [Nodosilinea sp. LEGE 06152]|uniref:PTPA-CTERM sorting domain-containing protein n=1 Tax=Nodosilinea sp. LEGE 06152 TaxID=2777966 RepID=UPI0018803564|nr:PTPA-CTERM sorting domain-containing protein [Nodosilinea sp. LEGE 06152]MBE9155768.1 PTPA-CTERM sorting domain-containing protein [Nodosilinea sp. LEGE 06152]
MTFKAFVSSAAIAGTLATGALVAPAPVEAATINVGSTINFSSVPNGTVAFNQSTGVLNFSAPTFGFPSFFNPQRIEAGAGTDSFAGVGPFALISDLTLTNNGGGFFSLATPVENFISFINLPPLLGGFNDVQFTLTKFIFNANSGDSTLLEGFFTRDGNTVAAVGQFTSQIGTIPNSSWSLSLVAVPTPALLPGLIGMGIAALRRKQEEASEENV